MQVNIILMLQKSCQIFLAFRAEDRIHGIRVPKLHIEKADFFNRKCLSVQIQRIADTIIRLHRSCEFWLHSCRLFFSLHSSAANLLQRLGRTHIIGKCLHFSVRISVILFFDIIPDGKRILRIREVLAGHRDYKSFIRRIARLFGKFSGVFLHFQHQRICLCVSRFLYFFGFHIREWNVLLQILFALLYIEPVFGFPFLDFFN